MKKLALVAQKGGVGKTTIAVNLAVAAEAFGMRTILFDLDPQESAVVWADRRKAEFPHVEFLTERRLAEALKAAEAQGFKLAIIDTPPAAGTQAYTAAQVADLALVPCRPSLVDLDAVRRTAQLVKSVEISAFVVFNAAPAGATTLLEDARGIVTSAGLKSRPPCSVNGAPFGPRGPLAKASLKPSRAARQPSKYQNFRTGFLHN